MQRICCQKMAKKLAEHASQASLFDHCGIICLHFWLNIRLSSYAFFSVVLAGASVPR